MRKIALSGKLALAALISCALGCAVGPNFKQPQAPQTSRYTPETLPSKTVHVSIPGGDAQIFAFHHQLTQHWWELFQSPQVNELITRGLHKNPSVQAAKAALKQAQANYQAQIGTFLPGIDLQAYKQREKFNTSVFGTQTQSSNAFSLYNTQLNISYTFDIFGGNRRQLEALAAQVDYQRFELEATYLSLASNIVTAAITEASLRAQIKATQEIITLEEHLAEIIRKQFSLGAVAKSDLYTQENQVAQLRASLPPLEKNLAQTRHNLAVLIGEFPSDATIAPFSLADLTLPQQLPINLPSQLVQYRPDIRAAEALLHQACAQIGVATANLLPQFTLGTSYYGWQSNELHHLISPAHLAWNVGATALSPIFRGGSLWAKRKSSVAAYEQALANYQQTVLNAFQNVADALRAIELDAQTLQARSKAEQSAEKLLALANQQYKMGAINYLVLLNAQSQYQQAVISLIQAQTLRYTDTAALFQALGGSWWQAKLHQEEHNG